MFDTPIWKADKVIGILCLEYKIKKDLWDKEEQFFITSIADFLGKIYEKHSVLEMVETLECKVEERTKELNNTLEQLNRSQKSLAEKEKLASLGAVVAGVAHELKNPLHIILNTAQTLKRIMYKNEISRDQVDDLLEIINDTTIRADETITDMLGTSKNVEPHRAYMINIVIEEALELTKQNNIELQNRIKIETNYESDIWCHFAWDKLKRAFINLFENAFFALKERGEIESGFVPVIEISIQENVDKVTISIKDNGSGIPLEVSNKLFDPFFTTKVSEGGTGLGLYLVYDTIRGHNGEINITSKIQEGTTVTIELPR